jgi:hypothetical protein
LTAISKEEADRFAIGADERASLIRLDSGKVNLVRRSANARWFKLVGVPLGNKTELYPSGDEIQTVERWPPPTSSRASATLPGTKFSPRSTRVCQTASSTATTAKPLTGQLGGSS